MARTWGTRAEKSGLGKGWSFQKRREMSNPPSSEAQVVLQIQDVYKVNNNQWKREKIKWNNLAIST